MDATARSDLPTIQPTASSSRRWRLALYSHDTMGLGHLRRNLLIAQALADSELGADILLISGAREANAYPLPDGVDCLSLPAICKGGDGRYRARSLDISLRELVTLRATTIRAALEAFRPDALIVDKVPRGAAGELEPALAQLRARGGTRCVLGLRDVLDDPATVRREWGRAGNEEAIREYYHAVWVYGDPAVYDPVREYRFPPDIAAKVRYAGYLDQGTRLESSGVDGAGSLPPDAAWTDPFVLCVVGGGQDGARLAEAFAQAELPPGTSGVIVTGPFMPGETQRRLRRLAEAHPRLHVLGFVVEPTRLICCADRVIAMGGYNTICEVLSFEKRALIVPRVRPRLEQWVRGERLRDLGLIDLLHPDDLSPAVLSCWLADAPTSPPRARHRIDLNGLAQLPRLLESLLAEPVGPAWDRTDRPEVQYAVG
jgi:predicted glycosyltransferase